MVDSLVHFAIDDHPSIMGEMMPPDFLHRDILSRHTVVLVLAWRIIGLQGECVIFGF